MPAEAGIHVLLFSHGKKFVGGWPPLTMTNESGLTSFIPQAKAGVQGRRASHALDSRVRGNDDILGIE
jgi:hypothetical protein